VLSQRPSAVLAKLEPALSGKGKKSARAGD
jgi:hypothetical protein